MHLPVIRAFARYQNSPVEEIWRERLIASRAVIERGVGEERFAGGVGVRALRFSAF